jgi:hypothetical protein
MNRSHFFPVLLLSTLSVKKRLIRFDEKALRAIQIISHTSPGERAGEAGVGRRVIKSSPQFWSCFIFCNKINFKIKHSLDLECLTKPKNIFYKVLLKNEMSHHMENWAQKRPRKKCHNLFEWPFTPNVNVCVCAEVSECVCVIERNVSIQVTNFFTFPFVEYISFHRWCCI